MLSNIDVAIIGGGPAGLAAAIAAERAGAKTMLIEREARLGGILKQCIHDGFGLIRFGEKLSGPEYAHRFIEELKKTDVQIRLQNFVLRILRLTDGFELVLSGRDGIDRLIAKSLILSTGCRERTARQAAIHGTHPAGVLTAGAAQYYTNILGQLPCRRCVILGSGDIGLIMARRLTLEGAQVLGVYEAKPTPSGLSRNIAQCLNDFDIPLYTNRTITRLFGTERLEAVEIAATDEKMQPVCGTEERIVCDGLILSVGLIPENELAESLGLCIHPATKGPVCDQYCMTEIPGVFSCGNALQVYDLVDYVSENGETAGKNAARFAKNAYGAQGTVGTPGAQDNDVADQRNHGAITAETATTREILCIVCPNGCHLHVEKNAEGEGFTISGNQCNRGIEFAQAEITNPTRTLTTTVRTSFPGIPVLPVRTDGELPKGKIREVMRYINTVTVNQSLGIGETVVENILGLGVNIIATSNILKDGGICGA
jgi:NADPH-dependent 2,4-dienoyl-CoA reductase/sulfur reductase-like enzyme